MQNVKGGFAEVPNISCKPHLMAWFANSASDSRQSNELELGLRAVLAQLGLSLKQNLVMMVTLVARSVLVNTMAALCANLALLTGAKAEPNNYGRGGGGQGDASAGP